MQHPRNHPGALADVDHENDRHRVAELAVTLDGAVLVLENVQDGSPLRGLRKTLRLAPDAAAVEVVYTLPPGVRRLGVEFAFSPDYLTLLREGREALRPLRDDGTELRGFAAGETAGWVAVAPGQPVLWERPVQPECGHAGVVALSAYDGFQLELGTGLPVAAAEREPEPVHLEIVSGGTR